MDLPKNGLNHTIFRLNQAENRLIHPKNSQNQAKDKLVYRFEIIVCTYISICFYTSRSLEYETRRKQNHSNE